MLTDASSRRVRVFFDKLWSKYDDYLDLIDIDLTKRRNRRVSKCGNLRKFILFIRNVFNKQHKKIVNISAKRL